MLGAMAADAAVAKAHDDAILGIRAVYDRHQYDDQKVDALKRLAALIETIINPPKANVVAICRRPLRQ